MELTSIEIDRYAPYHEMPQFKHGFDDYQLGKVAINLHGVEAQAYDRGIDCAMRRGNEQRKKMTDAINIPVSHDPIERARQREANVRNRIVEVLTKYNVHLETAPLDALTMAIERIKGPIEDENEWWMIVRALRTSRGEKQPELANKIEKALLENKPAGATRKR